MHVVTDEERREVAAGLRSANLADLIYQGDMSQSRRDIVTCDRDALLELTEEMVEVLWLGAATGEGLDTKWCRKLHDKYARLVREALGVSDDA